jgi:hypothetical protein
MMDDEKWAEALGRLDGVGQADLGRRIMEAQRRIERGVGLRRFYVTSHEPGAVDKTLVCDLSDEMAILGRTTITASIAWMAQQGFHTTEEAETKYGWEKLREIVRSGVVENRTEEGRQRWGHARMCLARLYDDLILSHHWPKQGSTESIFYLEGYVPPSKPHDHYLLAIRPDGRTFLLSAITPPAGFDPSRMRIREGQHRMRAVGRLLH